MNGAQALIRTLVDSGVDTCFTNPGTSEMHFVAALDSVPEMRGILGLFEGVVTGAADGYARMADKPAATLLHLAPGLGNGLANLHNARRAGSPMVNIVGDHATDYGQDIFLNSDIETVARNLTGWIGSPKTSAEVGGTAAEAIAAAIGPPGQIATLILPADASWSDGATAGSPVAPGSRTTVASDRIEQIAGVLRSGESVAIIIGGSTTREAGLLAVSRVAAHTGAKVLCECFPTRLERGAGVPAVERLGYLAEFVQMQLDGIRHLVLVDADSPASFFAYPDKITDLVPPGCEVHVLTGPADDGIGALGALAEAVGAPADAAVIQQLDPPDRPTGALDQETLGAAIAALLTGLNARPFKKLDGSRLSHFERLERPALRPLPPHPYEYAEWRQVRVPPNLHIAVDGHYYSVPHPLIKRRLDVRLSAGTVAVLHQGTAVLLCGAALNLNHALRAR